jgi:hypothetical protein
MNLKERAKEAREHAEVCLDPSCHALANALDSALLARKWRHDRDHEPRRRTDDLPPWSAVSGEDH